MGWLDSKNPFRYRSYGNFVHWELKMLAKDEVKR